MGFRDDDVGCAPADELGCADVGRAFSGQDTRTARFGCWYGEGPRIALFGSVSREVHKVLAELGVGRVEYPPGLPQGRQGARSIRMLNGRDECNICHMNWGYIDNHHGR